MLTRERELFMFTTEILVINLSFLKLSTIAPCLTVLFLIFFFILQLNMMEICCFKKIKNIFLYSTKIFALLYPTIFKLFLLAISKKNNPFH